MAENAADIEMSKNYELSLSKLKGHFGLAEVCRRVDTVELITNSYENIVNPLGSDYPNQKKKLQQTRAAVYEYSGSVLIHTKTILIDENVSIIDSFNMDNRSTYIDMGIILVIGCRVLNAGLRLQIINLQ